MAKQKQPAKKRNRIVSYFKEIKSELKKISWPTFAKVLAQLGVVLAVVVVFLIVVGGIDLGLTALLKQLVPTT